MGSHVQVLLFLLANICIYQESIEICLILGFLCSSYASKAISKYLTLMIEINLQRFFV